LQIRKSWQTCVTPDNVRGKLKLRLENVAQNNLRASTNQAYEEAALSENTPD